MAGKNTTTEKTGKQENQTAPVTQENQTAKQEGETPTTEVPKDTTEKAPDITTIQTQKIDTSKRPWLKSELKEEHMEELMMELYNYDFPGEAIQQTRHPTMKKDIL